MRIAVIPDTHFPYVDHTKILTAIGIIKQFRPDAIFQIGDLYDQLSFSNYPKDPNRIGYSPKEQMARGREQAEAMWFRLGKAAPKAKRFQLPGNHDVRIVKRMHERVPEASFIAEEWLDGMMTFDGVENVHDEFILDDIMFMHGFQPIDKQAKWNQMNTVTGHTHVAQIGYYMNRFGSYWGMSVGWLGDKSAYPFSYRSQKVIDNTHQGIGLIENQNPRFVMI